MNLVYTNEYGFSSSWVETLWHNENDGTAVFDLDDELYEFSDVDPADVHDIVSADSVGSHYNTVWKTKYGEGTRIGGFYDVDEFILLPRERSENTGGVKGLVDDSATQEFSLQAPSVSDSNKVVVYPLLTANPDAATTEYSLATPESTPALATDEADGVTSTVYFSLDGFDKLYEFTGNHTSVEGAIAEVNEYVTRFAGKGRVQQVVFDFAS